MQDSSHDKNISIGQGIVEEISRKKFQALVETV